MRKNTTILILTTLLIISYIGNINQNKKIGRLEKSINITKEAWYNKECTLELIMKDGPIWTTMSISWDDKSNKTKSKAILNIGTEEDIKEKWYALYIDPGQRAIGKQHEEIKCWKKETPIK